MPYLEKINLKRCFDVAAAGTGLVLSAPVVLAVGLVCSAATRQSPLFMQTRIGLQGNPFTMYKIRTMRDAFNADGHPLPERERTPTICKIIRKSRLDELPQLFNVLVGDMSLVGPRPAPPHYETAQDAVRITVRPGLTGLVQISNPNLLTHEQTLALDQQYIRQRSFLGDIAIIAKTPFALLSNWHGPHYRRNDPFKRTPE